MRNRLTWMLALLLLLVACQAESDPPTATPDVAITVPAPPTATPEAYPGDGPPPTFTPAPYPNDTPAPTETPAGYPGGAATVPAASETPVPTMGAPANIDIAADVDALSVQQGAIVLGWSDGDACQIIGLGPIGDNEVAIGPCRSQFSFFQFGDATPNAASDLAHFLDSYASFAAWTEAGYVRLNGLGAQVATPDEQRMIATWVRHVAASAVPGGEAAAPPLALSWQVQGGIAGFCHTLLVFRTGTAEAFDQCDGPPDGVPAARGYLTPDEVDRIFSWVDGYAAETFELRDDAVADGLTTTVAFSGSGGQPLDGGLQQAMRDLAGSVYNRLVR